MVSQGTFTFFLWNDILSKTRSITRIFVRFNFPFVKIVMSVTSVRAHSHQAKVGEENRKEQRTIKKDQRIRNCSHLMTTFIWIKTGFIDNNDNSSLCLRRQA